MQVAESKEVKSKESSKSELGSEVLQRDIEITREMIEAGKLSYFECWGDRDDICDTEEMVKAIYNSMALAQKQH